MRPLAYPSGLSGKEKGEGKLVGKRNGGSEYPQRAIKRRTEICEDQIDLEILRETGHCDFLSAGKVTVGRNQTRLKFICF